MELRCTIPFSTLSFNQKPSLTIKMSYKLPVIAKSLSNSGEIVHDYDHIRGDPLISGGACDKKLQNPHTNPRVLRKHE